MSPAHDLTESDLHRLIPIFYARVREDGLIGPVFEAAIHDWDEHLDKLVAFWSSVMLTTGRYKGNPVMKHAMHARSLTPEMFDRWLELWQETTDELLPAEQARAMQAKAERIGESLKLALWFNVPGARPRCGAAMTAPPMREESV